MDLEDDQTKILKDWLIIASKNVYTIEERADK